MVLKIHSESSYLPEPKLRSRCGGYFYLRQNQTIEQTSNGVVHLAFNTVHTVVTSASEVEYVAMYLNEKYAIPIRTTLMEMRNPQPATPLQTDNQTGAGIANQTIKPKYSKSIDVRYHWL